MGNDRRDLFDVLGISTREDSYTTLLANVFNEPGRERWAQNYFEEALTEPAPAGPIVDLGNKDDHKMEFLGWGED